MSLDFTKPLPIPTPKPPMPLGFRLAVVVAIVASVLGVAKAWEMGYRPEQLWQARAGAFETVAVDQGDMSVYVREMGTVESASNTTVRCQVEALIGLVGGNTTKAQGGQAGGAASGAESGSAQGGGGFHPIPRRLIVFRRLVGEQVGRLGFQIDLEDLYGQEESRGRRQRRR